MTLLKPERNDSNLLISLSSRACVGDQGLQSPLKKGEKYRCFDHLGACEANVGSLLPAVRVLARAASLACNKRLHASQDLNAIELVLS